MCCNTFDTRQRDTGSTGDFCCSDTTGILSTQPFEIGILIRPWPSAAGAKGDAGIVGLVNGQMVLLHCLSGCVSRFDGRGRNGFTNKEVWNAGMI